MSRTPEQTLNDRICFALGKLDPVRVENAVGPGTPDIAVIGGWIESKVIHFPTRVDTVVRIPHYTKRQRAWHHRHASAGGSVVIVCWEPAVDEAFLFQATTEVTMHLGVRWSWRDLQTKCDGWIPSRAWRPDLFRDQYALAKSR